jgi:hypothetical protein
MAPFEQKRMLPALHAGGRPSEYDHRYCDMVVEDMAKGFSLSAFAGHIRKGRETVYGWMSRHREFADAVARGRAARTAFLEGKLLSARYGAQCSAAIFGLKNAAPDEWRDVKYQEHQHTHAIRELTDAQLLAIAAGQVDVADIGEGQVIDGESVRVQQPNER